jgi:hypothetical protein
MFYILLTVHLGIIVINNQLDAQFLLYIFRFSTCFEQPCAHHQGSQLYQYNTWYMETVRYAGRDDLHTGRSPTQSDIYQMLY